MEIELLEIQDFLATHAPFDQLPAATLALLPSSLSIRYLRRGQVFPPANVEPALYIVRQGAIDLRNPQGVLIEKLAEGELYTAACEHTRNTLELTGETSEDCLLYSLSCQTFEELCREHSAFGEYFNASLFQRLQRILDSLQQPARTDTLLEVDVGKVLRRQPVTASPDMRIIDAAQLMTNENLSSLLLVADDRLCGMVTDHDMRSRCLAKGMDATAAVRTIMTTQLHTIDSRAQTAEALLLMNQHNVHHLPVVDNGKLTGIISSTDLMRQQSSHSPQLARLIHNARDLAELIAVSQQLPPLQSQLVNANVPCYRIGQIISSLGDALTQRLIALAQDELGPAPIAYAWLASGSLARQEMTVISDQDNAMLLSDHYDEKRHGRYFEKLAQFVCDGLDACGIAYCPGKVMAMNPDWRQPVKTWQAYFTKWVNHPDPKGVMLACNFFDLRVIAGDAVLFDQLFPSVVALAQHNQIFLAHLAANATRHSIPLGFFRQFVLISGDEHRDTLDLKHGGVSPITELARLFALAAGLTCINTYERLQQAGKSNQLSRTGATDLLDALKVINSLRLRHHMRLQVQGRPIDNFVDPQTLSQVERHSLKEAFSVIRDMHSMLAQRYQTERFFT